MQRRKVWGGRAHPVEVMELSFAVQALSVEYVQSTDAIFQPACMIDVTTEIDEYIARLKLAAVGATLDTLSTEQKEYICSWNHDT